MKENQFLEWRIKMHKCEICGCYLDAGEHCDCYVTINACKEMWKDNTYVDKDGQLTIKEKEMKEECCA